MRVCHKIIPPIQAKAGKSVNSISSIGTERREQREEMTRRKNYRTNESVGSVKGKKGSWCLPDFPAGSERVAVPFIKRNLRKTVGVEKVQTFRIWKAHSFHFNSQE